MATGKIVKEYTKGQIDNILKTNEITSNVTWNESVTSNTHVYAKAGLLIISFQGESKTHAGNDVLFTLPSGYRPIKTTYSMFVVDSKAYGSVYIETGGECKINMISSTSASGRIYFTVAVPYN